MGKLLSVALPVKIWTGVPSAPFVAMAIDRPDPTAELIVALAPFAWLFELAAGVTSDAIVAVAGQDEVLQEAFTKYVTVATSPTEAPLIRHSVSTMKVIVFPNPSELYNVSVPTPTGAPVLEAHDPPSGPETVVTALTGIIGSIASTAKIAKMAIRFIFPQTSKQTGRYISVP